MDVTTTAGVLPQPPHPWITASEERVRFGAMAGPREHWPVFIEFGRTLEALGFDSYWASDHPLGLPDAWTSLTALAVTTRTLRLGTLVSCVYYHRPALLARLAADVDRLSGGRLVLGLGIGDHSPEFTQLGIPFASTRERQAALAEAIVAVRHLWSGQPVSLYGQHVQLTAARLNLPPLQQPRVPLLIAGGGERTTLRQVADYADMANFGPHPYTGGALSPADVRRKLATLRVHCATVGRPFDSILRSHVTLRLIVTRTVAEAERRLANLAPETRSYLGSSLVAGTPATVLPYFAALKEAGIRYFIVGFFPDDPQTPALMAEQIMPALG